LGNSSETPTYSWTPVKVHGVGDSGFLSGISSIAAGAAHTIAIGSNEAVYAWGQNTFGQLGDKSTTNRLYPVLIRAANSGISQAAAGGAQTMFLDRIQYVLSFGYNAMGQLGSGNGLPYYRPDSPVINAASAPGEVTPAIITGILDADTSTFKYSTPYDDVVNIAAGANANYHDLVLENMEEVAFTGTLTTATLTATGGLYGVRKISFAAASEGSPNTISEGFYVNGTAGYLLELGPISPETTWYLDAPAGSTVTYLRVGYSHQANGQSITATSSQSLGGNSEDWNISN
jgi:hypothetical protein